MTADQSITWATPASSVPAAPAAPVPGGPGLSRVPGAEDTLFGGYGPFVALVALILAMALLAPTIAPERDVTTRPGPAAVQGSPSSVVPDHDRSWSGPCQGLQHDRSCSGMPGSGAEEGATGTDRGAPAAGGAR